ncbi:3-oxoacyl-[acyl-carrier protein] reductase [Homoserinimonas aerilata]|uniref:3-oxoacyl-[acyl-carrier protein] reductase n=1 Tax=Homoserinimonas aerilata TaxID=1162970 RepID=A0A542YEQ6_9MICO|nr:3-oxoacyl-ACP reductase FabG [Homoserinimonas aerilata]TQL46565.1 3-oxoacyl-[acyl-carrier protein] reductase [Homoserinimonas aerilata]
MSENTKTAIVTGGARGIGAAVAKRLAEDGFAVGVLDIDEVACANTVEQIRAAGGRAITLGADVSNEEQVEEAVARCARELGAPVVLINNAGIIRDNPLFKMSTQEWDLVLSIHLKGSFLMTRAVQSHMTKSGWGRIINMSSISALGNKGQSNYAAAKAGIQGFTKTLAIELGKFGVTANCIAPGYIETDMLVQTADRMGISYDEFASKMVAETAVARMGQPEDIAAAVAFFARDDASFVTGQILYVAGGPYA